LYSYKWEVILLKICFCSSCIMKLIHVDIERQKEHATSKCFLSYSSARQHTSFCKDSTLLFAHSFGLSAVELVLSHICSRSLSFSVDFFLSVDCRDMWQSTRIFYWIHILTLSVKILFHQGLFFPIGLIWTRLSPIKFFFDRPGCRPEPTKTTAGWRFLIGDCFSMCLKTVDHFRKNAADRPKKGSGTFGTKIILGEIAALRFVFCCFIIKENLL